MVARHVCPLKIRGNMKEEKSLVAAAQQRFSDMDTDALSEMWANEGRTDWAEQALRLELINRGVSELELDTMAQRRADIAANAPPSTRDTIWNYGVVGRMIAVGTVLLWLLGVHAAGGTGVIAAVGSIVILGLYVHLLKQRVAEQKRHPSTSSALFAMSWQLGEAWFILALAIIISIFSL